MREREFYEQTSDEELVEEFSRTSNDRAKEKLFERYFERFDWTVRAVLRYKNVPYNPTVPSYNEVFFAIYGRVFGNFRAIASGFNPQKGNFKRYFLRVIRNATIDWLREKDPQAGITHEEALKLRAIQEGKRAGLVTGGAGAEKGIPTDEILKLKAEEEERLEEAVDSPPNSDPLSQDPIEQIEETIRALSANLGIMMRLLLLAHLDIGQEDIDRIAREALERSQGPPGVVGPSEIQRKGSEVRGKIRQLKKRLLDEMEERERLQLRIEFLEGRIELFRREARAIVRNLEKNFGHDRRSLREIDDGAEGTTLKEIAQRREELLRRYRTKQIDAYAYGEGKLICDYQEAFKRIGKAEKRLSEEKRRGERAKKEWLPRVIPTDKELQEILEIPEGTLFSRKSRAKKEFQEALFNA